MRLRALVRDAVRALPGGPAAIEHAKLLRDRLRRARGHGAAAPDLAAAKERFRAEMQERFDAFMDSRERLILPSSAHPKVCVVLVLWNQAPLTLACLQGLAREDRVPLEVIIVDNASSDRTGQMLERVDGARILRNAGNLGFLKAVNQGIAEARGDLVLLLNNDAVVRPGSLAAAVDTLESGEDIGAVGGRIVLLNGRLQEAGSIIWRDGRCLGYARDADPEAGEAMFRRDVDYCSGAFLLFRRTTFQALGGFDEAFAPAYYEETDFCLRLWQNGLRVVYEPRAVIDHFEFGSSEKSASALDLQARNRTIFLSKHQETLKEHCAPDPAMALKARMRDKGRPRVLMIDERVPLTTHGAGYPRARRLIQEVAASGRFVTFYPLQVPTEDWEATYASLPREVEVAMGYGLAGLEEFLKERRGYYDLLLVSRPRNMAFVSDLRRRKPTLFAGCRIVYDAEAVFATREMLKARLLDDAAGVRRAQARIAQETALGAAADHVIAVSDAEAAHFQAGRQGHVTVIGHVMEAAPTPRAFRTRRDLLFVGALEDEDSPNVDSLVWFVGEVMPRLRGRPGAAVGVQVAGRNRAPSVQALRAPDIHLHGPVEDLVNLYDQARVFIAPTRFAGGIPHKVHEAAAHGLPVVATSLLAAQLGWRDGEELLVADDPDRFAAQVARLYDDEALWHRVRAAALDRVRRDCDPATFRARLRTVLDR